MSGGVEARRAWGGTNLDTPIRRREETREVHCGRLSPELIPREATQNTHAPETTHTSADARQAGIGPWTLASGLPPSRPPPQYPYRVCSQVRGKTQGAVELVQALVEASCRVNAAHGALALHKEGGPLAKETASLVDPLFFGRVKLKPTAAAHAAAGAGGGASLLSSSLCV